MADSKRTITDYVDYTTEPGDTFDSLAFQFYTDEQMSSEIIIANPDYSDVLIFDEPIKLKIPVFSGAVTPDTLPPWRR